MPESKEIRKWRNEEALKRYRMIAPLLDTDIDEAKRRQMREEIAERRRGPCGGEGMLELPDGI